MEKINKYKASNTGAVYNSFYTSLSILPSCGLKMRCYGSTREYPFGVIFALPQVYEGGDGEGIGEGMGESKGESEDEAAKRTNSWSWPAGYAAKTEFNIGRDGDLMNGRDDALVSISHLRKMNHSYIYDRDYGKFEYIAWTHIEY